MQGMIATGAILDDANLSRANLSPAEPPKPSTPPRQPTVSETPPSSTQDIVQALTKALAAQQPLQHLDLKPSQLDTIKSAKKANFTGANLTGVVFDGSNLDGAIFDTADISTTTMSMRRRRP